MRRKKYSKERFYRKLEAQSLNDPILTLKLGLAAKMMVVATNELVKIFDNQVKQNQVLINRLQKIRSKIVWNQALQRIKTMERVDRIIKPAN